MWNIERTEEYSDWFKRLDDDAKEAILQGVLILAEIGPALGRPHTDTIKDSRYSNMKELRVQNKKRVYRIFYAFDKKRTGILLIGGNKKGENDRDFYDKMVPLAEEIYKKHLEELEKEEDSYGKTRKKQDKSY